jgi:hypothetical protein
MGVCLYNIFVSERIGHYTASVLVASGKAHQGALQEIYFGLDVGRVTSGRELFQQSFLTGGLQTIDSPWLDL